MIRYVITFVNYHGLRVLAHHNDGRTTFLTKGEGTTYLADMIANNSADTLASIFGKEPKFEVTETICYAPSCESARTVFGIDKGVFGAYYKLTEKEINELL